MDRTKESGSLGEPLFLDVVASVHHDKPAVDVIGGRYGLGDKAFTPAMVHAVYENLRKEQPKRKFTVGIEDDVTHLSLDIGTPISIVPKGTTQCIFWGMGSDGTVGSNRSAISLIGNESQMYAQGYFFFTAHKSGGVTMSHLRFGTSPITSTYPISTSDYVACHQPSYLFKYPMVDALRDGGVFVLNCLWSKEEIGKHLPVSVKKMLALKKAKFFAINAYKVAKDAGLGGFINGTMQAVFFKLSGVLPVEKSIGLLKESVAKTYKKKGKEVIEKNQNAIDMALSYLFEVEVPQEWASLVDEPLPEDTTIPEFVRKVKNVVDRTLGDNLPVSAFNPNGATPPGTSKYEKRMIATQVPVWVSENCIQCNTCSMVCPHAVIRPFALTDVEKDRAPESFKTIPLKGAKEGSFHFRVQISPMDCTGCGVCSRACPAKNNALVMTPIDDVVEVEKKNWEFAIDEVTAKTDLMPINTVKGSQFLPPLQEFSAACAGCGEMGYMRLLTQLYGERMVIANASGCSAAVALTFGSAPYCQSKQTGWGPAIANSLFEENAEFGFGLSEGHSLLRQKLRLVVEEALASCDKMTPALRELLGEWIKEYDNGQRSLEIAKRIQPLLQIEKDQCGKMNEIFTNRDAFIKFSTWLVGGDGWAYDINFQGLDHVLSIGSNLKVIVLDTEVYSNTGGQKSKATPKGSVHKFASAGKSFHKKDLGMIAMMYETVYVGQISLNANPSHALKTIQEAESYAGPALLLCYAPCIEHGIEGGDWVKESKLAVSTGYWPLFRFNPALKKEGKNPFSLDSKRTEEVESFIAHENRFLRLVREKPESAALLQHSLASHVREKFAKLEKMAAEPFVGSPEVSKKL